MKFGESLFSLFLGTMVILLSLFALSVVVYTSLVVKEYFGSVVALIFACVVVWSFYDFAKEG